VARECPKRIFQRNIGRIADSNAPQPIGEARPGPSGVSNPPERGRIAQMSSTWSRITSAPITKRTTMQLRKITAARRIDVIPTHECSIRCPYGVRVG
jgi:hypothetical protein